MVGERAHDPARMCCLIWAIPSPWPVGGSSGGVRSGQQLPAFRGRYRRRGVLDSGSGRSAGGGDGAAEEVPMFRLSTLVGVAIAVAALGGPARLAAQSTVQTQPIDPFGQEVTLAEKTILFPPRTPQCATPYDTPKQSFHALH